MFIHSEEHFREATVPPETLPDDVPDTEEVVLHFEHELVWDSNSSNS